MSDATLHAEIVIKFKTIDLIEQSTLDEDFNGNFEEYVKMILDEESLHGIMDDSYEILSITKKED